MRRTFAQATLVLTLAALAPAAHAVTAPDEPDARVEIPRPSRAWQPDGYRDVPESERLRALARAGLRPMAPHAAPDVLERVNVRHAEARRAYADFAARPGVRLEGRWDERAGAPHRVQAFGVRVAGAGDLTTAGAAEAAARGFIRDHAVMLTGGETPSAAEMPLVAAHRVGDVWFLTFGERWHNYEVIDGRVDVRLRTDGSIPLFGSSWFADVSALDAPRVVVPVAQAVGRSGLSPDAREVRDLGADVAVLPVDDGDEVSFRLVHRVRQRAEHPIGVWTTYVDAQDGRVWARENSARFVDVGGSVSGSILPYTYTDAFVTGRMPFAVVYRGADSTFADANGNYLLPGATTGEPLGTAFRGPFLEVWNDAGENYLLSAPAPAGGSLDWNWTPATADSAARNAYYQAMAAHAYVKALDPGFVGLDYRVPCFINIPSTCNAYWDGSSINFFRYGGGCPNTATIADVIFHEYGHGVTQFTFAPGEPNGAMHEGFSDYLAATMKRSSVIGLNFRGPGTHLRDTENTVALPAPQCNGEVHCLGNAVSGALWDMQQNLMAALGDSSAGRAKADSLWHYSGYGGAFWFDDYFLDLLVTADNDGTLLNGTPFFGEICSAFTAHGFTCPDTTSGCWIVHTPLPDSDPTATPFTVDADMGSFAAAPVPGSAKIVYRYNNGLWDEAPMALVSGNHYQGQIPAPPGGGKIDYSLSISDASGLTGLAPESGAYSFTVGTLSTIFADDFETDRGWTSITNAVTGRWMRVDPHGTSDQGFQFQTEDDHTPGPGVLCYVTGDTTAGLPPGTVDVDGGCVYLVSPTIDLSGVGNAHLSFWRWFTEETSLDDSLVVDLSSDNGATWERILVSPQTENFWKNESFDLASRIPLTSQFRMRIWTCDLGGGSLTEAALDDFAVTTRTFDLTAAPEPVATNHLALEGALPQPSTGASTIFFTIPGGEASGTTRASLRLYDARGRLVRVLAQGEMTPGRQSVRWDGSDAGGRRVAAGTYLLRLEAQGRWATSKLVLAR